MLAELLAMLGRTGQKILFSVLGVVVCLTWWTLTGSDGIPTERVDRIPQRVHGGGGGCLAIEVDTSIAAIFHSTFERSEDADATVIEAKESLSAGKSRFEIDMAEGVYVFLSLETAEPPIGATLSWRILLDGKLVVEESRKLEETLRPGWAFGLSAEIEDLDQLRAILAERDGGASEEDE